MPSRTVLDEPTRSITDHAPLPSFASCFAASGALPSTTAGGTGLHRRVALDRVDIDKDRARRAHHLCERETHQAQAHRRR